MSYTPAIRAGVAQRQSNRFVSERLEVQFLSPAPSRLRVYPNPYVSRQPDQIRMHSVQTSRLSFAEEQEDHQGALGAQQVLQNVQEAHAA